MLLTHSPNPKTRIVTLDRQTLAVLIPVLAVFFGGLAALSRTVIGQAIAQRIAGPGNLDRELQEQLDAVRQEVDSLRRELLDTQERLDFTERMLASVRETGRLAGSP